MQSRRQFIGTAAVTATAAAIARGAFAGGDDAIKVGLVGCGGRGTGAASQALHADSNVKLTAMADVFDGSIDRSLKALAADAEIAGKVSVPPERRFVGFDAAQRLIDSGVDVVLLATPPHFRPMHLKAAVAAGKHVFAEKPVAVDAPGVQSVIETCEAAKAKGLCVVSGLCLRNSDGFRETVQRLHDGAIGKIHTLMANDYRGPIWVKPREPGETGMHWQVRNWYYFTWLSGDFNVEQHIHFLDVCAWLLKEEYPTAAVGMGGRQVRTGPEFGNIYDHHSVVYEYAGGRKCFSQCRQQPGCHGDMSVQVIGTRGRADIAEHRVTINGEKPWRFRGETNDLYQAEHDDLFASIRSGKPLNHGPYMANSTLMAIQGRLATYTGQTVTWKAAQESREDLSPPSYDWTGTLPTPSIATPGVTQLS